MPKPTDAETIADAINDLSKSIRLLGNGNIDRGDNSPGAIENLAAVIKESNEKTAMAIGDIAESIRELAQAVQETRGN